MKNNASTKRYPDGTMALGIFLMELYDVFTIIVRVFYPLVSAENTSPLHNINNNKACPVTAN